MSKILFPLALSVVMFIAAGPIDAAGKGGKGGSSKGGGGSAKGSGTAKTGTGTASNKGSGSTNKGGGSTNKGTGSATNKGAGSATNKGSGSDTNKGNGKGLGSGKGTKFDHGILYRGRDHNHWGARRYDARYGCECYWDPYVLEWYYWCEPDVCFYPVSYCPYRCYTCTTPVALPVQTAEPAALPAPIVNNTNAVQVNVPTPIPVIPEPIEPRR